MKQYSKHVIICNGRFPTHLVPIKILEQAQTIICCDGAADDLINRGYRPTVIIGDMDSISKSTQEKYQSIVVENLNQETNDQTKAIEWAISHGITDIVILGATGLREDHAIGNISLLADYGKKIQVCSVSNNGIFTPVFNSHKFESYCGQQVSIFSLNPDVKISSHNLKYPLQKLQLKSWWMGTLNESLSNSFSLNFLNGNIIVFQVF